MEERVFDVREWVAKKGRRPRTPHVSQPRQVACWTKTSVLEGSKLLYNDTSGLLQFRAPQLPADLNDGFPDAFIEKPADEHSPVEQVAGALRAAGVPWGDADVVTFRNNLNKIALSPLKERDGWVVHGCQHARGPLFLDINPRTSSPGESYPNEKRFSYYGYKFEQLCTVRADTDSYGAVSAEPLKVDSTSEFAAVMRIRIGGHRIMMGAEMDCCESIGTAGEGGVSSYVELKTFKAPEHPRQRSSMARFKYPTWWVQSWLAGVSKIGMGERDAAGKLTHVELTSTRQLPNISSEMGSPWNPWQLISFLDDVLAWMRARTAALPGQHLTFEYTPTDRVITSSVDVNGSLPRRIRDILNSE